MVNLLYIEPSVLIFEDREKYLFYDTLSYRNFLIGKEGIEKIIERILQNKDRHYYTEVTPEELQEQPVKEMIIHLKELFFGDLVTINAQDLPAIFTPMAVFQRSKLREDGIGRTLTSDGFNNLREVTFFNDCSCSRQCRICNMAFRQTCCCYRESESRVMPLNLIRQILEKLMYSGVYSFHFVGAELVKRTELQNMLQSDFGVLKSKLVFYFPLGQWWDLTEAEREAWKETGRIVVNVFEEAGDRENIEKKLSLYLNKTEDITLRFLVTSGEEYEWAARLSDTYVSEIIPIYTGGNIDFFKSEVFISSEDILSDQHTMKQIHGRQFLNYHYFGKILIKPDGEIAGIWDQPIGNVNEEELAYLVEKLLLHDSVWLKTRNEKPCEDCLYRWLCPSPSDYEYVIGQQNLCHVRQL